MPILIILSKSRDRGRWHIFHLREFRAGGAEVQSPKSTIGPSTLSKATWEKTTVCAEMQSPKYINGQERSIDRSGLRVYFPLLKRLRNGAALFFDNFRCLLARPENARRWVGRSLMISGNHRGWRNNPSRSGRYPGVCSATALLPALPAFPFSF
jgi:hypothetical protein